MAWEKWQYWYAQRIQMIFKMSGAINRMQNLALSRGWEKWQEWYAIHKDDQFKLNGEPYPILTSIRHIPGLDSKLPNPKVPLQDC